MYLALDIGGTKTEIGLFQNLNPASLDQSRVIPTPPDFTAFQSAITEIVTTWNVEQAVEAVGVSLAARINPDNSIGVSANLQEYQHQPVFSYLAATFDSPVMLRNDALCAARAEIMWDIQPPVNRLLHLVLGTGFGGAFVYRSPNSLHDMPFEPSRIIVQKDGRSHHSLPLKGQLGAYISANSIRHFYHQDPQTLSDDDPIWSEVAEYLALGIYNLSILLSPEMVTFSGGCITHRPFLLELASQHLQHYSSVLSPPPLKISALSQNPCLIGALSLFL